MRMLPLTLKMLGEDHREPLRLTMISKSSLNRMNLVITCLLVLVNLNLIMKRITHSKRKDFEGVVPNML